MSGGRSSEAIGPGAAAVLLAAALALVSGWSRPADARILQTRTRAAGQAPKFLALTIGSAAEYESDAEQTEWGLPFFLDYGLSDRLTLTVEPVITSIRPTAAPALTGFGDLETSASYGLVSERRHRPAVAMNGVVKWPTAAYSEFGTGERDYTLGAQMSKAFVQADLDLSCDYTMMGNPPGQSLGNTFTIALALEHDLSSKVDLLAEWVAGRGGSTSTSGTSGTEAEGTVGLAEQLSERLKLEQGVVVKSDGTWQLLFSWEWEFGDVR